MGYNNTAHSSMLYRGRLGAHVCMRNFHTIPQLHHHQKPCRKESHALKQEPLPLRRGASQAIIPHTKP